MQAAACSIMGAPAHGTAMHGGAVDIFYPANLIFICTYMFSAQQHLLIYDVSRSCSAMSLIMRVYLVSYYHRVVVIAAARVSGALHVIVVATTFLAIVTTSSSTSDAIIVGGGAACCVARADHDGDDNVLVLLASYSCEGLAAIRATHVTSLLLDKHVQIRRNRRWDELMMSIVRGWHFNGRVLLVCLCN